MQLGEPVTIGIVDQVVDGPCPFAHEKPKSELKNELGGVGTKLGGNMANGKGIHTTKPPSGDDMTTGTKEPDPRAAPSELVAVKIRVNGKIVSLQGRELPYPLTCAAHHLIPAQESLKGHPVLEFMCNHWDEQDFLNGKEAAPKPVSTAKVWGNVAYNVNGCQNGVWLPGNYAVGAGVGGVEIWKSRVGDKRTTYSNEDAAINWVRAVDLAADEWAQDHDDPQENEEPQESALQEALETADASVFMLAGTNYKIDAGNPKWAYVKAAMDATGGQFHDRHEPYSKVVKEYLDKIFEAYSKRYDAATDKENGCKECKDAVRPAKAKTSQVGPPYAIVLRLEAGGAFFKQFVKTNILTAKNIYTSRWVKAWIDTKASS